MAAPHVEPADLQVVDLRTFGGNDIRPLLDEQTRFWNGCYQWDFAASKDVILRFIEMRSLRGYTLVKGGKLVGYSYFVHENRKALVGDLFIAEPHRTEQAERFLLYNTLQAAAMLPAVSRIEGQLLALTFNPCDELVRGRKLAVFERLFMFLDEFSSITEPHPQGCGYRYNPWSDGDLDSSAALICQAYENHVDSLINDQYRSIAGARRFLHNSTQHPGCGLFYRPAALAAEEPASKLLCGVCLGSLVQPKVGHITQLCVAPFARSRGIGYELMRRSVGAFRSHGCGAISLTVTSSNREAVGLYKHLGFRVLRKFFAFVWETP